MKLNRSIRLFEIAEFIKSELCCFLDDFLCIIISKNRIKKERKRKKVIFNNFGYCLSWIRIVCLNFERKVELINSKDCNILH